MCLNVCERSQEAPRCPVTEIEQRRLTEFERQFLAQLHREVSRQRWQAKETRNSRGAEELLTPRAAVAPHCNAQPDLEIVPWRVTGNEELQAIRASRAN